MVCLHEVNALTLSSAVIMTLDQLLAFRAVASAGTFAAAAAQLHKSQPAISKLVQNLEAELGVTLFDRSAYRATLSDTGKLFLERTTHVLTQLEALEGFAHALRQGSEPVVRLVVEAIAPLAPVLRALDDVQRSFPAVRYELRTERLIAAQEALRDASTDLVIATARGLDARSMTARAFGRVRILPVVRRDHALARAGNPVPTQLLRQYAQVVVRDSTREDVPRTWNVLEGGLRWTVTDLTAKLQIIEAGMGWGGLPEHLVAPKLRDGTLGVIEVREFDVDAFELFVIQRNDRLAGPVAHALWTRLTATPPI
jgi:DNA-binding transcriptional LysR family regulator